VQELFYAERYSEVYLSPISPTTSSGPRPWAVSASGLESAEEVAPAIEKANGIDDRPVVIDFRTDRLREVYPMVPAGSSNERHHRRSGRG